MGVELEYSYTFGQVDGIKGRNININGGCDCDGNAILIVRSDIGFDCFIIIFGLS